MTTRSSFSRRDLFHWGSSGLAASAGQAGNPHLPSRRPEPPRLLRSEARARAVSRHQTPLGGAARHLLRAGRPLAAGRLDLPAAAIERPDGVGPVPRDRPVGRRADGAAVDGVEVGQPHAGQPQGSRVPRRSAAVADLFPARPIDPAADRADRSRATRGPTGTPTRTCGRTTARRRPWHDFHATLLHLFGIDHERLTLYHNGIHRRLTNVHGEVVREALA